MSEQQSDRADLADRTSPEDDDLEVLSSLAEPTRRALYEFVSSAPEPVTRDEAAEAVGVTRQVAAYHLDRLAG